MIFQLLILFIEHNTKITLERGTYKLGNITEENNLKECY